MICLFFVVQLLSSIIHHDGLYHERHFVLLLRRSAALNLYEYTLRRKRVSAASLSLLLRFAICIQLSTTRTFIDGAAE